MSLLLLASTSLANAQELKIIPYRVKDYNIQNVGYPSEMVPLGFSNAMAYAEFWKRGTMGHRQTNWYVQAVYPKQKDGQEIWQEAWNLPITRSGEPKMHFRRLIRLKKGLAAIGQRPVEGKEYEKTILQAMTFKGRYTGKPQEMTPFKTDLSDFRDHILVSANNRYVAWIGYDPEAHPRKAKYYASVWDGEGRRLWREALEPPNGANSLTAEQFALDQRGNLFMLMRPHKRDDWASYDATSPQLVQFQHKQQSYETYPLQDLPGKAYPFMKLHITDQDQLMVLAATGTKEETGLKNGEELERDAGYWQDFCMRRYSIRRQMTQMTETCTAVPDSLIERYRQRETGPANFSTSRVVTDSSQMYWLMEEAYKAKGLRGQQYRRYDVGILQFDRKSSQLNWANFIKKRQRTRRSKELLSYSHFLTPTFLHLVYLTETGASGRIVVQSINRDSGGHLTKPLISNESGRFLFFPQRSVRIDDRLMLMGMGHPNEQDYYLLRITQFP